MGLPVSAVRLAALSFALALAVAAATPAAAVITVSNVPGNPDPPIPSGFTTVVTFDTSSAGGIVNTISGAVTTAAGDIGGVRAAPAGTPDGGVYQSVGTDGVSTFDFGGYLPANRVLTGFSLYWGSVDDYNFVDFLTANDSVVATFGGAQLPRFDGNQTIGTANPRVTFLISGLDKVTKVRMRSTSNAFEYDTFAVTTGRVPEPASWAMLISGFGLVGAVLRRRRAAAVAA
jgi:hypothetical protein